MSLRIDTYTAQCRERKIRFALRGSTHRVPLREKRSISVSSTPGFSCERLVSLFLHCEPPSVIQPSQVGCDAIVNKSERQGHRKRKCPSNCLSVGKGREPKVPVDVFLGYKNPIYYFFGLPDGWVATSAFIRY